MNEYIQYLKYGNVRNLNIIIAGICLFSKQHFPLKCIGKKVFTLLKNNPYNAMFGFF